MCEDDYNKMIMHILNNGPDFYKKILFACLSFQNPGRICEHDIFTLLENFKQMDSFYFYKELITQKNVPRDFKDVKDNSDQIFFEAFSTDIKLIAHAMDLRKRLQGVFDNESEMNFDDDVQLHNFDSRQEYEEELVNQIQYVASIVSKHVQKAGNGGQKGHHHHHHVPDSIQMQVLNLLLNETSLQTLRSKLIQIVVDNKMLQNRPRPEQSEDDARKAFGGRKKETQGTTVNFLKPPSNIIPCIGAGVNQRTGNQVSNCIYLNYEDFNKLVVLPKDYVSSFIDDLVDHLSCGLISVNAFEQHLGHYRDQLLVTKKNAPARNLLESQDLVEFLQK